MVPAFVNAPVMPPVEMMFTPIAPLPEELLILPLLRTTLFELRVTAAPVVVTATEPVGVIVMFPGVAFAALAVETATVVAVLMVRSSALACQAATAATLHVNSITRFTIRDLSPKN